MSTAEMADELVRLRLRVQVLEDIEAIRMLRMKYHYIINEGLFSRAAEIYTEDAYVVWSTAGTARGHEQIVALFETMPNQADFVKHFVSNPMVEVRGDEATGLAYVDARYAAGGESSMIAGKYEERYRRTEEGWRISETILDTYFKATLQEGWGNMVETFADRAKYA
jgi:ketosteroid isomerase-like protein